MGRVLIVNGGSRKQSNTRILASHVADGAREKGHQVEIVDIGPLNIRPCTGCNACLAPEAKGCVIRDDMQALYPKVSAADVVLYASPLYWCGVTGQTKQFIDRCYAIAARRGADGKSPFAAKKVGLVMTFNGPDVMKSGCVNAVRMFEEVCGYTGAAWASALYGRAPVGEAFESNKALLGEAREYGRAL